MATSYNMVGNGPQVSVSPAYCSIFSQWNTYNIFYGVGHSSLQFDKDPFHPFIKVIDTDFEGSWVQGRAQEYNTQNSVPG